MTLITHKAGEHNSSPFIAKIWLSYKNLSQEFAFTESCKYQFNDSDQYDWNKLTGISFNLLDARKNTIMCAWRYNIENDVFELCAYYHIDGSFNPPAFALCSVKANEKFKVDFEFNKGAKVAKMTITKQDNSKFTDQSNFKCFGICRQVNTWFGGTKPAPHNMTILKYN